MSKGIEITNELIQKAKETKSVEEFKALAKENDVELNDEQAAALFSKLSANGELADDELDAVVGGGCSSEQTYARCIICKKDVRVTKVEEGFYVGTCEYCSRTAVYCDIDIFTS